MIITSAILGVVALGLSLSLSFSLTETRDHRVLRFFSAPSVSPDVIRTSITHHFGQYGTGITSKAFFIYGSGLSGLGKYPGGLSPLHHQLVD